MKKLLDTLFNHERYQTIAVITVTLLLTFFYGCPSQCPSLFDPDQKVTRAELEVEINLLLDKAEIGLASIEQQDKIKNILLQQALLSAGGGGINPVGLITSITAILGIGATVDNVRKRKQIKRMSNSNDTIAGM